MSRRDRRHPGERRIVNPILFPHRTVPTNALEALIVARAAKARHEITFVEIGDRIYSVLCTPECGFEMAAFGEEHAARIREDHYSMFHVIPDARGARYRD